MTHCTFQLHLSQISKRPEWNEGQTHFFQNGDEADLEALAVLLEKGRLPSSSVPLNKIAAVFTEFQSNPLLKCHNLKRCAKNLGCFYEHAQHLKCFF